MVLLSKTSLRKSWLLSKISFKENDDKTREGSTLPTEQLVQEALVEELKEAIFKKDITVTSAITRTQARNGTLFDLIKQHSLLHLCADHSDGKILICLLSQFSKEKACELLNCTDITGKTVLDLALLHQATHLQNTINSYGGTTRFSISKSDPPNLEPNEEELETSLSGEEPE